MRNHQLAIDKCKGRIIVYILDRMTDKALAELKVMAGLYNVALRKSDCKDVKMAFREFILNDKGYNVTMVDLYNALKNNN